MREVLIPHIQTNIAEIIQTGKIINVRKIQVDIKLYKRLMMRASIAGTEPDDLLAYG